MDTPTRDFTPSESSSSSMWTSESPDANENHGMREYQYRRLPPGKFVRLLKLKANPKHEADVVCHLRTWDLDSSACPKWTAISYTWSTIQGQATITIVEHLESDGQPVQRTSSLGVRDNVLDILRHLRQPTTHRWLWIDSICIDQQSTDERKHQVLLMGRLYREANRVIAWLGAGQSHEGRRQSVTIDSAFDLIQPYSSRGSRSFHWEDLNERTNGKRNDEQLVNFCRLRYWTRKWIIQEVVEAKSVVIQAGDRTMPMSALETIFRALSNYEIGVHYGRSSRAIYKEQLLATPAGRLALHRSLRHQKDEQIIWLHQLLVRYQDHQCKEPWDHIYALYNLLGSHGSNLQIDYTQDVPDLYESTVAFLRDHDRVPEHKWLSTTTLLMRLLKLDMKSVVDTTRLHEEPKVPVTLRRHTGLKHAEESSQSEALRLTYHSMNHMPPWSLSQNIEGSYTSASNHACTGVPDGEPVGPQDFAHFRVGDTPLFGLASCRVQPSDELWQVDASKLDFIVKKLPDGNVEIIGRAFTYVPMESDNIPEHSSATISMTTDESILLGWWADGLDPVNDDVDDE